MMRKLLALCLMLALLMPVGVLAQEIDYAADAKLVLEQMLAGDVDAFYDRLSPEVQAVLSKEDMAASGAQVTMAMGNLISWGEATVLGGIVTIPMEFEAMQVIGQVIYGEGGAIIGLGLTPAESAATRDTTLAEGEEDFAVGAYALPGVLTMPLNIAEGEQVPAVVLVHGSGPNDRDESLGDVRIFRDIAHGLAAEGIAVLRYDKRTYAIREGMIDFPMEEIPNITVYDETIEDAVAAVAQLRQDPRIDPTRVYVLGHSQGGMLAVRIQQEGASANGLIILAGTLRHLGELVVDQLTAIDQGAGMLTSEIETAKALPAMTEAEAREAMLLGTYAYSIWEEMQHDLVAAAEANEAPMLILQGTEDQNVYAAVDYVLWEEFASAHPDKDMELHLYEGLGHALDVDGHFSPEVLADMIAWVKAR